MAPKKSGRSAHFTLSMPPSETSSANSSPLPSPTIANTPSASFTNTPSGGSGLNLKAFSDFDSSMYSKTDAKVDPGQQAGDVYDTTMHWWRAGIRRRLVRTVYKESQVIAAMQNKIRTPWLDAYFVYTSSLGTHTFFMILLPAFFFFGFGEMGRGLLIVLGVGVYMVSFIKDLFCSPRPFAPPVTRLTIGSHHLEYGFPSTHSTNSVSIALFFFGYVHQLASSVTSPSSSPILSGNSTITSAASTILETEPAISGTTYTILCALLLLYSFSIVFGRLYTAMHSFTDCIVGVTLGAGVWWGQTSWGGIPAHISPSSPLYQIVSRLGFGTLTAQGGILLKIGQGLGAGRYVERWMERGGWEVPLILIPICLFLVHKHPQPVDDCPCFEDAIAFASVVLGALVARWAVVYSGVGESWRGTIVMPGSGLSFDSTVGKWIASERGAEDILVWWGVAALKMVVGVLTIFAWRILAKSALHLILPPTFRLLARAFSLPRRRFYTPATEYKSVPSEFQDEDGQFGLRPIPSVIDLPSSVVVGVEVGGIGSGVQGVSKIQMGNGNAHNGNGGLKNRNGSGSIRNGVNGSGNGHNGTLITKSRNLPRALHQEKDKEKRGKDGLEEDVKHYDADVLTKVIVYAGIAILATEVLPLMFDALGWGTKSWIEV